MGTSIIDRLQPPLNSIAILSCSQPAAADGTPQWPNGPVSQLPAAQMPVNAGASCCATAADWQ